MTIIGKVQRKMEQLGFVLVETGGCCTAYELAVSDGGYWLVTRELEPMAPTRSDQRVLACKYQPYTDTMQGDCVQEEAVILRDLLNGVIVLSRDGSV